tara:strand:+ start:835 stop:2112 length:1278 start_codon:yes stop_codon:yes gene_type:complete
VRNAESKRRLVLWTGVVSVFAFGLTLHAESPGKLQKVSAERVVARLVAASRIYDKRAMAIASNRLVEIGHAAIPALLSRISDVDDNVRWQVAEAIGRIGQPSDGPTRSALVRACSDGDADVRGAAAVAVGQLRVPGQGARAAIQRLLTDPQPMVRADAWWAWWELTGDRRSPGVLQGLLTHSDWLANAHASGHLARIGRPAVGGLMSMIERKPGRAGRLAAETLRSMGRLPGKDLLTLERLLSSTDPSVVRSTGRVLGAQGAAGVPILSRALSHPLPDTRQAAVVALGDIGSEAAPVVRQLTTALRSSQGVARIRVVETLGQIGPSARPAMSALLELAAVSDADTRGAVCRSIGRIGAPGSQDENSVVHSQAVALLKRLKQDDRVDVVRRAAAAALGQLTSHARSMAMGDETTMCQPAGDEMGVK